MKRYALLGEKLSHSYSPLIHKEILKDFGIEGSYSLLEVSKEDLGVIVQKLRTGEYDGFNVTIPYKIEIMQYLDFISDEAKEIGSVNTIVCEDGRLIGYNTDYYGIYNELVEYKVDVKDKNCYILGTGGASLAVYKALKDLGGLVWYVSRNPKNEQTISYQELETRGIDCIVNTTPVGMYPHVGVSPVSKEVAQKAKYVVDIIFNPKQTQLLKDANSMYNGLYMLVGQAVKAQELWQKKEYKGRIELLLKRIEEKI